MSASLCLFLASSSALPGEDHYRSGWRRCFETETESEAAPDGFPGAEFEDAELLAFDLRGHSPTDLDIAATVVEVDGVAPHIQVRSDYQIIAYRRGRFSSGLASLSSAGNHVLVESASSRYRPREEGAFVSPDGRFLAVMVQGDGNEEMLVLRLDAAGVSLRTVEPPLVRRRGPRGLSARSLTMTSDALFFAARYGDEEWLVCRALLEEGDAGEVLEAEVVAGAFRHLEPYLAHSQGAVAFLAGEQDNKLDVHVARAAGDAINVTRDSDEYFPHRPGDQTLAVDADGRLVAYVLEESGTPETFCHAVGEAGRRGRRHVTRDSLFARYIEQDIFIFFAGGHLVLAAGHDRGSMDVFSTATGNEALSLTQTGGFTPTFRPGSLTLHQVVVAGAGVAVIDASASRTGLRGVLGVSVSSGSRLFAEAGFRSVGRFQKRGSDLYFEATTTSGEYRLYRVRQGSLTLLEVEVAFVRGDANSDGRVDMSDSLRILDHLFLGAGLSCPDAADANDNGRVDLGDATLIQQYLSGSRLPPSAPFPIRGRDPTADALSCR